MRAAGETIHGRVKLIGGVVMLATPVRSAVHLSLRIQVDILHNKLEELFESGTINDVTNVFLILDSSTILVSIQILIGILDDLQDTLFICPLEEINAHTMVLLTGTAKKR